MLTFQAKCASLLATAVLLAACGGGAGDASSGNGGAPAPSLPPGSAVIGSGGGSVTSDDGKVKLVIPAGALGNDQTISIESVDISRIPAELTGADTVYDLKPDGLNFMQPVQATVVLPPAAQLPDGTLSAAAGALVSMSGGGIETLGDQTITVSGVDNRVTARGTLTHFSKLAFSSRLSTSSGIQVGNPGLLHVRVKPLPKLMIVGKTERATFETAMDAFSDGEFLGGAYQYTDNSAKPALQHIPEPGLQVTGGYGFLGRYLPTPLPRWTPLDRYGDYVCTIPGLWRYEVPMKVNDINLVLKFVNRLIPLQEVNFVFENDHSCVTAAPPAPPPPPPLPPTPPQNDARVIPLPFAGVEAGYQLTFAMLRRFGGESVDHATAARNYGVLEGQVNNILVLAAAGRISLVDVVLGEILAVKDLQTLFLYAAFPYLFQGQGCLYAIGPIAARTCYDPAINDYGLTQVETGGFSDAGLLGVVRTASGLQHRRWRIAGGNVAFEVQAPTGEIQQRSLRKPLGTLKNWFADGEFTGEVKSAAFSEDLDYALVVTGGADVATQLWFGRTDDPNGGKLVATMGPDHRDAREIRCDGAVCAISHLSGNVHALTWDGRTPPQALAPIPGTTGAVGIDVSAAGVNFAVFSADYRNNTVTKAVIGAAGTIVSTSTKPLPQGCTQPGHAVAFRLPDGNKVVVSCSGGAVPNQSALAVLNDTFF